MSSRAGELGDLGTAALGHGWVGGLCKPSSGPASASRGCRGCAWPREGGCTERLPASPGPPTRRIKLRFRQRRGRRLPEPNAIEQAAEPHGAARSPPRAALVPCPRGLRRHRPATIRPAARQPGNRTAGAGAALPAPARPHAALVPPSPPGSCLRSPPAQHFCPRPPSRALVCCLPPSLLLSVRVPSWGPPRGRDGTCPSGTRPLRPLCL